MFTIPLLVRYVQTTTTKTTTTNEKKKKKITKKIQNIKEYINKTLS